MEKLYRLGLYEKSMPGSVTLKEKLRCAREAGFDYLEGGHGNDTLWGEGGNDRLYGDSGNDPLNGQGGADFLDGGFGNDVLDGGAGDDTLFSMGGSDTMTGGSGKDTFRFADSNYRINATIKDYEVGIDVIDFTYNGIALSDGEVSGNDVLLNLTNGGVVTVLNAAGKFISFATGDWDEYGNPITTTKKWG